ncbi:MAG: PIG-L deacetylase family protein [Acidimicrobiales bacterium]
MTGPELIAVPEDWDRALAVVAHPDDMEYGAAGAVARWVEQGKTITYLLVTDGEAGIDDVDPAEAGPIRRDEQRAGCAEVGVTTVEFLGLPDGLLVEGLELRRLLAEQIRIHRPDVLLSINFRDSWGGPSWNHVDHRVVGRSLLDAARDAANRWVFTDLEVEPWTGIRMALFSGSPESGHAVDVTDHLEAGIASLQRHALYLSHLGGAMADADRFLRSAAETTGPRLGVPLATPFELVNL